MLPKPDAPELEELLAAVDELRLAQARIEELREKVGAKAQGDVTPISHPAITRVLG